MCECISSWLDKRLNTIPPVVSQGSTQARYEKKVQEARKPTFSDHLVKQNICNRGRSSRRYGVEVSNSMASLLRATLAL